MGLSSEKNVNTKVQSDVLAQIGNDIFNNVEDHLLYHRIGESNYLTSLHLQVVIKNINI